jgi:alpha-tubulin suppressor-like RCC1 family protein
MKKYLSSGGVAAILFLCGCDGHTPTEADEAGIGADDASSRPGATDEPQDASMSDSSPQSNDDAGTMPMSGDDAGLESPDFGSPPVEVLQVSVGPSHACAIVTGGDLYCWGKNDFGQLGIGKMSSPSAFEPPGRVGNESDWDSVAAGPSFTCGTRLGEVWCWGRNDRQELALANGVKDLAVAVPHFVSAFEYRAVAAGYFGICALNGKAGSSSFLACWGRVPSGVLGNTSPFSFTGEKFRSFAVGDNQACGIAESGQLYCWGANFNGELGRGNKTPSGAERPYDFSMVSVGPQAWTSVGMGTERTCGVSEGRLFCWGRRFNGSEFPDYYEPQTSPLQIGTRTDWASTADDCAIRTDGSLWCWGANGFGQVGTEPRVLPDFDDLGDGILQVGEPTGWTQVARAESTSCGVRAGQLECWGSNLNGLIPGLSPALVVKAQQVGADAGWTRVAAGSSSTCAIRDGQLFCWGPWLNLGARAAAPTSLPGTGWTDVSVGPTGLGVGVWNGNPYRWGGPRDAVAISPVYDGQESGKWTAVSIAPPDYGYVDYGDGWDDAARCGIRDRALSCTGWNYDGDYGSWPADTSTTYQGTWKAISLGSHSACAISTAGELWCWGGADGNSRQTPLRIGNLSSWSAIDTASRTWERNWGVRAGELHAWNKDATSTTKASAQRGWQSVAAGGGAACGIRQGALYCWGDAYGLGVLTGAGELDIWSESPALIDDGSKGAWQSLALGESHGCAIRGDGTLWCWGTNLYGELGLGRSWSATPVTVALE